MAVTKNAGYLICLYGEFDQKKGQNREQSVIYADFVEMEPAKK